LSPGSPQNHERADELRAPRIDSTVKRTLKGLKKGRTYYVRIRAYRKVDGKTYRSAWSAPKKAKVR